ncbi:plasmid pRiA4b ORF-3 family protein, partial [Mycobacterium helveticum]
SARSHHQPDHRKQDHHKPAEKSGSDVSAMSERPHLHLVPEPVSPPDLRRARRRDVVVYRVRVYLDDSDPTIWRRLDLRSNLTLDLLHQVLQVSFDWTDSHLHRFSLGGGAFDHHSQLFLCPYDVDNKEWPEDDDGLPAAETQLDETLSEPGDVLHYLYDYGDNWELTLRLEEVLPAESHCPAAVVIDGERAAPPEDCGHLVDADSLAEVLRDPALFALERVNKGFGDAYFLLREAGIDVRLVDLVHRLTYTAYGDDLTKAALTLAGARPLDTVAVADNLRAYQWFLDRAKDGGIPLTTAGYLKPADVEEASKVVPVMNDWIGKHNREVQCYPLLRFREAVQSLGLLRKHKGTLLLTKAGVAAQGDADRLWDHLAGRLIPKSDEKFQTQATLLMLTYAAGSAGSGLPFDTMTALLAELGWRYSDGRSVSESSLRQLPVYEVLINVTDQPVNRARRNIVSPAAAALARRAFGGN